MQASPVHPVLEHYLGEHGAAYFHRALGVPPALYDSVARLRARKLQPYIWSTHRVLEYGVGTGLNLAAIQCADRYGFDITDAHRTALHERGIRFVSDTSLLGDGMFDVVICHHVLEHVHDPWSVLAEIRRVLAFGRKLVLVVPFEHERRYRRFDMTDHNGHLYSWNVQTLGTLLQRSRFSIESIGLRRYGYDRFAAQAVADIGLGEKAFRALRAALLVIRPHREIFCVCSK